MSWVALVEGEEEKLKVLAEQYRLHPLHIEDCHHGGQNAKLEDGDHYVFVVLKPVQLSADFELTIGDFDIFLGPDYLITYEETGCGAAHDVIQKLHAGNGATTPEQIFYRLMDHLVDSYNQPLDQFSEEIDRIEDEVLANPTPKVLEKIFCMKRGLIQMRRILTQTRDVASSLMRGDHEVIRSSLRAYFRDIYDHLTRGIETVEMARDMLTGALDIYLSSMAQRTNDTMKVVALFSAITLPTVAISSFFGMNFEFMPLIHHPNGLAYTMSIMAGTTLLLAIVSRWFRWL